jgi:hypothetical protein
MKLLNANKFYIPVRIIFIKSSAGKEGPAPGQQAIFRRSPVYGQLIS